MLPRNNRNYQSLFSWIGLLLLGLVAASPVYAFDVTDLSNLSPQAILNNIAQQLPELTRLATALAYIIGMYFIIVAITKFKHMGESRTMMSHEHSVKTPIIYLVLGAALLYFPSTVEVGMSTFWDTPNPYGYVEIKDQWQAFINVCFQVVQFVGVVAFIRGLVMLSQLSGHSGGHNAFSKGMTHIIGGILCINIYEFVQVIFATLGLNWPT